MADNQEASFIPKRNPSKKLKRAVTRRVYLFTFLSYVALFVVLILSGALYGYSLYLDSELSEEISGLDQDIKSFKVAEFERLVELDRRLDLAEDRFSNQISMAQLLALLENSTVRSIQYKDVSIERTGDRELTLIANIISNDFDSAIYQREIYKNTDELSGLTLDDIAFSLAGDVSAGGGSGAGNARPGVVSAASNNETDRAGQSTVVMTATFTIEPGMLQISAPTSAPAQPALINEPVADVQADDTPTTTDEVDTNATDDEIDFNQTSL